MIEIVKCCATCEYASYSHKKGKTALCQAYDIKVHQLEKACEQYVADESRINRIINQIDR